MFNLDDIANEHNKEHGIYSRSSVQNVNIGGSRSGKTNALFNLIKEQDC